MLLLSFFNREVMASPEILDMPERANWKACAVSKEEEMEMAAEFRKKFAKFDFNADDDDDWGNKLQIAALILSSHQWVPCTHFNSSRVVKDSTPSQHRILRCINFGIGESSPNIFLNMMNLYLVKFEARWILNERTFYGFIILFIWKWILT